MRKLVGLKKIFQKCSQSPILTPGVSTESSFKSRLTNFEDMFDDTSGGSFFLGKKPYYCDFGVYHHLSLLRLLEPKIFDNYPKLNKLMNAIESIESISK